MKKPLENCIDKIQRKEDELEFLYVSLYTDYLSILQNKFQVVSTCNTKVEYQIWWFCCNLLLTYAHNRPATVSATVTELEFQSKGEPFSRATFIRKLTQMLVLTLFSRILDGLNEKRRTQFDFLYKISIIFMHLLSKLTSEIYQKLGSFDEKTKQNRLKVPILPSFFLFFKKPLHLLKNKKC